MELKVKRRDYTLTIHTVYTTKILLIRNPKTLVPYGTLVTLLSVDAPQNVVLPLPCSRLKMLFRRNNKTFPCGAGARLSQVPQGIFLGIP